MKHRFSLWLKILLVAFLNVALLLTIFLIVAKMQFRLDLNSFLLTPARERMLSLSRLLALELPNLPRDQWDALLAQYSATYSAQLSLLDHDGSQLAGESVQLPPSLFQHRPPPPGDHDFGPPSAVHPAG